MGLEYKPDFYLTADDKNITDSIKKSLISLSLTDNSEEDIDTLSISLLLPANMKTPTKGAQLKLRLGFDGKLVDKGTFIVDEVSTSGPPRITSISASAAPLAQEKKGKKTAMQTQQTKSYDDVSFRDLIAEISAKHGLEPKVSEGLGILKIKHIDQTEESDMSLLSRLAKKNDAVVKASNGSLLFLKKGEGKSVSGKELQNINITPPIVSNWQCRSSTSGAAQKVTAKYRDLESGGEKEVSVGFEDPVFTLAYLFPTKQEAESAIKARINSAQEESDTIDITMPATPNLMPLVAQGTVTLSGFGDIEDRVWQVRSLAFSLTGSGLQLRIAGVTKLEKRA